MEKITFINSKGQSVELGNDGPFILIKIEGTGAVNVDIQTQKTPFQDGEMYIDNTLEPRSLSIEIMVLAKDKKEMIKNRRKLLQVFNPKLSPGKLIYEFGNNRKEIEAISELAPVFPDAGDFKDTMQPSLIQLYCPNPFWQDIEGIETDLVTWIPNLEFDAVEGFSTEQLENHWIETQIKKQGLQVFKKGTIYLELEEESTVPEVEIAYLLENGQYKRLRQQATVFSTGTGYDENGNYVDVSDSIVNGQINDIKIEGKTYRNILEDYFGKRDSWAILKGEILDDDFIKGTADGASYKMFFLKSGIITLKPSTQYTIFVEVRKNTLTNDGLGVTHSHIEDSFGVINSIPAGEIGIFKFLVTTKSDLTNTLPLRMFIPPTATSGEIEFRVMLLEGDYTNENISYIRGTKSTLGAIRFLLRRNLLRDSNELVETDAYLMKSYYLTEDIEEGEIVTISLKGELGEGKERFGIFNSSDSGSALLVNLYPQDRGEDGIYRKTFAWKKYGENSHIRVYQIPLSVSGVTSTIEWIKLEKGTQESTLYVTAKDEEGNILELRSLPNGVKDEIDISRRRVIKRIEVKSNITSGTIINFTDMAEGGTYYAWNENGETETGTKGDTLGINATVLIYQLANPIVKLLPPEPLTTFEEFESGIGVGEPIEFGYRLTKQIVEIENIGDVDAPIRVVFRAHGQVEKPYIQDVETREMIRINKTLEAGDVLEITTEFGNKNVFLNGEKAHHYLDFLNSTWIQLKPGVNLIKYGAENGVELLECRLFYTPRYLGV